MNMQLLFVMALLFVFVPFQRRLLRVPFFSISMHMKPIHADVKTNMKEVLNWTSGIQHELEHHSNWLCGPKCGSPWNDTLNTGWFAYERSAKLNAEPVEPHRSFICNIFKRNFAKPADVRLMVDHGAGPFTNLGLRFTCPDNVWPGVDAQVIAVDPLAAHYNSILNKYGVHKTLRTATCGSEMLSQCVGTSVADFTIIINALDHAINAVKAFLEAMRVTKIGGISCVYSIRNEASHMAGKGFHHWNFDLSPEGNWIVTNWDTKERQNMDLLMKDFAVDVPIPETVVASQMMKCYKKTGMVPMEAPWSSP